jgi:hypothetical protein
MASVLGGRRTGSSNQEQIYGAHRDDQQVQEDLRRDRGAGFIMHGSTLGLGLENVELDHREQQQGQEVNHGYRRRVSN